MILRVLIGLLIGLALGVVVGTISFYTIGVLFPEPNDPAIGGSIFWNIAIGFIVFGLPSAAIGAIVGGYKSNKYYSAAIGASMGLLLILIFNLYLLQRGDNLLFEEQQTGWTQLKGSRVLIQSMLLGGLTIVAVIVSVFFKFRDRRKLPNKSLDASAEQQLL